MACLLCGSSRVLDRRVAVAEERARAGEERAGAFDAPGEMDQARAAIEQLHHQVLLVGQEVQVLHKDAAEARQGHAAVDQNYDAAMCPGPRQCSRIDGSVEDS